MKGTLFKKLVAGALALLMVGTALPQGSDLTGIFGGSDITASAETYSGQCGEDAFWSLDTTTGKLTITGTGWMSDNPWSSYSSYITSVEIEKGITNIRFCAFLDCINLASVTIPGTVEKIDDYAFGSCISLASVTIPSTVTTIAGDAFRNCTNLTSIYMLCDPSTLTWNFTDGRYLVRSGINAEDEKIKVYYPTTYAMWYFMHRNDSSFTISDAKFIPGYNVSVDSNITHGRVSADRFMAGETDTVTLTVTPDEGYEVKSVSVNGSTSGVTKKDDGTYSFTMTGNDANVSAEFDFADGMGARLYGHSISLDGDIGVNFYMDLDDSVKNSETAKMIFTVPNGSKTETQELNVKEVTETASNAREIDGVTYYQFKCKVSAKDMASDITAQIVDGDTKGTKYTYSVREYAKYILDNSNDYSFEIVNLVKAMLNYGSAAQEYFGVGGTLANDGLNTGYSDVDKVSAVDIIKPYDPALTYLPEGVTFEGVTLSLKSETTLSLYFKSENEMTFVGCDNLETSSNYDADVERTGDYWVFRIRGISANLLDDRFRLNISLSSPGIDGFVRYCPLIYCYNVLDRGEGTRQLQKVCKALYLYNQAANIYFG